MHGLFGKAQDLFMDMQFNEDKTKNGPYIFGYREDWHWTGEKGGYNQGRNFFWVHWEISHHAPAKVKLHVESPAANVDPELNAIKQQVVTEFLSPNFAKIAESGGFTYKASSRAKPEHVEKFKCTSPFHIILTEEQRQSDHRANIELVHRLMNNAMEAVVKRYSEQLNQCISREKSVAPTVSNMRGLISNTPKKSENELYALFSPAERERRAGLLGEPHVKPLSDYLARIRADHPEKELPYFDPCDGGICAKVLFLLEAPGPKAVGSTFISRNNPDPTARNMCDLLDNARISRSDTIIWNIVPWYVGNEDKTQIRPVDNDDIRQSLPYLKGLLDLLPDLKVIVLVGKKSQSAKQQIRLLSDLPLVDTHHPSARVFNVWPHKREEMAQQLAEIAALINA